MGEENRIWRGLLNKLIECLNSQVPQRLHEGLNLIYPRVTFTIEA